MDRELSNATKLSRGALSSLGVSALMKPQLSLWCASNDVSETVQLASPRSWANSSSDGCKGGAMTKCVAMQSARGRGPSLAKSFSAFFSAAFIVRHPRPPQSQSESGHGTSSLLPPLLTLGFIDGTPAGESAIVTSGQCAYGPGQQLRRGSPSGPFARKA
jgi:hypothetical protein